MLQNQVFNLDLGSDYGFDLSGRPQDQHKQVVNQKYPV